MGFFSDWETATVRFWRFGAGRIGLSLLLVIGWYCARGPPGLLV